MSETKVNVEFPKEMNLKISFGQEGVKGDKGEQGIQGPTGKDGLDGKDGKNGLSAFEVWQQSSEENKNKTQDDFFASLKGATGERGPQGETGLQGEKGEPFRYENFTREQLEALKPKLFTAEQEQNLIAEFKKRYLPIDNLLYSFLMYRLKPMALPIDTNKISLSKTIFMPGDIGETKIIYSGHLEEHNRDFFDTWKLKLGEHLSENGILKIQNELEEGKYQVEVIDIYGDVCKTIEIQVGLPKFDMLNGFTEENTAKVLYEGNTEDFINQCKEYTVVLNTNDELKDIRFNGAQIPATHLHLPFVTKIGSTFENQRKIRYLTLSSVEELPDYNAFNYCNLELLDCPNLKRRPSYNLGATGKIKTIKFTAMNGFEYPFPSLLALLNVENLYVSESSDILRYSREIFIPNRDITIFNADGTKKIDKESNSWVAVET